MSMTFDIGVLEARLLALEAEIESLKLKTCTHCGSSIDNPTVTRSTHSKTIPMNWLPPSQAILACLRETGEPIGVGRLKRKLESTGYPMEKLKGNYFYTLIWRLAETGKIMRGEGDEIMVNG